MRPGPALRGGHAETASLQGGAEIFQIAYSEETLAGVDPDFQVLDNRSNPRPDWWEIWPIRDRLRSTPLHEDRFYGFLSPRFAAKTRLTARAVIDFVRTHAQDADVIAFSPQVDMGAFFLNLHEQNELFDPGFLASSQAFYDRIPGLLRGPHGGRVELASLLMDSRQVIISNYFVARPAFWRRWLSIVDPLIECCEDPQDATGQALRVSTSYKGAARKVFLAERIASTILVCDQHWRTRMWNPFELAWSASRLNQFPLEAVLSDALKIAARETGHPQYMAAYAQVRERLMTPDA